MRNKVQVLFMFLFTMLLVVSCDSIGKVDEFTIDFIVDGKNYHQMVYDGKQSLVLPDTPTKENFEFVGWFLDKDTYLIEFTPSYKVTVNVTVYAKWNESETPIDKIYII